MMQLLFSWHGGKGFRLIGIVQDIESILSFPSTYAYLFQRSGTYVTAYRPPLFPLMMAIFYSLFGRQFGLIRLFNCIAMAVTGGITSN